MSANSNTSSEPYLVPFGRERGGYLDVLGLPADASDAQARAREADFRQDLERTFKLERRALKELHKEGKLTKEELDEKTRQLEEAKNQKLTELNERKSKFDAIQSERRKLANEGRRDENVNWLLMYPDFGDDPSQLWSFLLEHRPPGTVPPGLLDEIVRRWLTDGEPALLVPPGWSRYLTLLGLPADATEVQVRARDAAVREELEHNFQRDRKALEKLSQEGQLSSEAVGLQIREVEQTRDRRLAELNGLRTSYQAVQDARRRLPTPARADVQPFLHLPSTRVPVGPLDLNTLGALATERDLITLLTADALWGEVGHTNRGHWSGKVAEWTRELATLGPHLRPQKVAGQPAGAGPALPALSEPSRRSIDRLEAEELGTFSQQPDRSRRQQQAVAVSLENLLAMLGGSGPGGRLDIDSLRAMLGRLGELPDEDE